MQRLRWSTSSLATENRQPSPEISFPNVNETKMLAKSCNPLKSRVYVYLQKGVVEIAIDSGLILLKSGIDLGMGKSLEVDCIRGS